MIQLKLSKKIFNKKYLDTLEDTRKYQIYYGGAGSGKSYFIAQRLVIKCCEENRRVLVIRKTMASQRDSCWKLFIDVLSKWQLLEYIAVNKSNYELTFPNGAQILFKGIDDPEKIKSITGITDCWIEESTELTEDDFSQLILRLRTKNAKTQFFLSFNPCSKANWVYRYYFAPESIVDNTTTMILKTTYLDNQWLPKDYVDSLENMINTNPTYYKIYALGEFCTLDKLVYNNWKIEEFDHTKIKGELMCGLDFGYVNDLTAFSASILDEENKTIYIFKEWCDKGKTNDEISRIIINLGFGKSQIVCDSAEPKSIEELKRNGLTRVVASVKGKDSIMNGIQKLQQYKILVHPSCTNTITELQNYSWKKEKNSNEYLNEPVDEFNHSLDSIRYALQCVGKGHLKSVSKSILGL